MYLMRVMLLLIMSSIVRTARDFYLALFVLLDIFRYQNGGRLVADITMFENRDSQAVQGMLE